MHYNYIFIFDDVGGYTSIQYNDLKKSSAAQFIPLKTVYWKKKDRDLKDLLCKLHFSRQINKIINLPFKNIWENYIFDFKINENIDNSVPYCFIIHARCFEKFDVILINYLRNKYSSCKIILYYTDLVKNHRYISEKRRCLFDAIFSFEKNDADKHGFIYYDNPYSKIDIISLLPKSDIFFIGKAKNRLNTILSLYDYFTENGINCDFIIAGVNEKQQCNKEKIKYVDFLEYNEVIKHIISTKCILEVLQDNAESPTLRSLEAVCYNKKLLTNCSNIKNMEYYNPNYISIFRNLEDIDINFIKNEINNIDYNYHEKVSPLEMIRHIDENIHSYLKK